MFFQRGFCDCEIKQGENFNSPSTFLCSDILSGARISARNNDQNPPEGAFVSIHIQVHPVCVLASKISIQLYFVRFRRPVGVPILLRCSLFCSLKRCERSVCVGGAVAIRLLRSSL